MTATYSAPMNNFNLIGTHTNLVNHRGKQPKQMINVENEIGKDGQLILMIPIHLHIIN